MSEKRINVILGCITQKKQVTLKELNALFPDYNEMTIRRDLILLEKNGYIERIRGGAKLRSDVLPTFESRNQRIGRNVSAKQKIALKALSLIQPNSSIYLDAGSTCLELAKILPDMHLFVTTNDPLIALDLQKHDKIEIILTGGSLNKSFSSLSGPISMYALDKINIDLAFMGTTGVDPKYGFTNASLNECELKRKVIFSAKKSAVLADSSKFEKAFPYTFASFSDVNTIVTDERPTDAILTAAEATNTELIY